MGGIFLKGCLKDNPGALLKNSLGVLVGRWLEGGSFFKTYFVYKHPSHSI